MIAQLSSANAIFGGQPFLNSSPNITMDNCVQTSADGSKQIVDLVVRFPRYRKPVPRRQVVLSSSEVALQGDGDPAPACSISIHYYDGDVDVDDERHAATAGEVRFWCWSRTAATSCYGLGILRWNDLTDLTVAMRPDILHAILNECKKRCLAFCLCKLTNGRLVSYIPDTTP